ncbi:MAG: type II secretory pathway component PulF [Lentimonas sp.]|jgi:type II secretory pathway component PulF
MPQFNYKARQQDGTTATGTIESVDRRQAAQRLREQKLSPITLKETKISTRSSLSRLRDKTKSLKHQKTDTTDKELQTAQSGGTPKRERIGLAFLTRLLELHASGLPIGDSIRILSQRLSDPEQKQLATTIWRDLSEGATLAGALARQSKYFSNSITYVIEAGEATGHLAPILHKVIDFLEEKQAIRQKMITSMAYPSCICLVAFVVVVIFLTVLLPQIQKMLDRLGGELTWSAQLLISGSHFLIQIGPFALVALIIGIFAFNKWSKTTSGRKKSDKWQLKIPIVGRIIYYSNLFQSGNLISTLLESGINTTEVMRLTERTIKNTDLRERFRIARNQINEGLSVAQALKRNQFMPDLAIDILAVGEDTGNLVHSMNEITKGFRNELTKRLNLLTNLVASAALACAFLMVALIAIGIVTSVFQVSQTLSV